MSKKVQVEIEVDAKYVTLTAPGCPEHIAKIDDEASIGAHILELHAKAEAKTNGEPRAAGAAGGEEHPHEDEREPDLAEAVADVLSTPGVGDAIKGVMGFLGAISTPRKE